MRAMITKRQLGIIVIVAGLLVAAGTIGIDLVGAGQWGGFGPLQRIGLCLGAVSIVVGLILFSLGDRPA